LRAAVGHVHPPGVDRHLHAAQAGDAVHHQQAAVAMDDLGDAHHRLERAGGGLGMYQGDELGRLLRQRGLEILRGEHVAPLPLHAAHLGPVAARHVAQPLAEIAVHADQHRVARLDEIAQRRLHAGTARAGDGDRERVLRLKDIAQQVLHLVHQGDELRVEVAHQRMGHRTQHTRGHRTRPGAQQDAGGRIEVGVGFSRHRNKPPSTRISCRMRRSLSPRSNRSARTGPP